MNIAIATVLGATAGFLLSLIFAARGRSRQVDQSRAVELIVSTAKRVSNETRGAPEPLLGSNPVLPQENWQVNAQQIEGLARVATAVVAFFLSREYSSGEELVPERTGLRFALWWHGLSTTRPPHHSLNDAWNRATAAPSLAKRARHGTED